MTCVSFDCTGNGYLLGFSEPQITLAAGLFELHILMYEVSHLVACVSRLCLISIHLGLGLDAERVHSWPPSVSLYVNGLEINKKQQKETLCNIERCFNQINQIITKYITSSCVQYYVE